MSYKLELSAPLIHESAKSSDSLVVRYGKRSFKDLYKRSLKDPYIVHVRLSNIGRKDIQSSDFDQAIPLRLDLGVKIVALLKATSSLEDMPPPKVSVTDRELNIGPSLIPRHATIDFALLVDGPCTALTSKSPLASVDLKQELIEKQPNAINLKTVLGWALLAFVIWWVIEQPTNAARFAHAINAFFSSL